MGCPFLKIPSLILSAALLGSGLASIAQEKPAPLQAPPPLPPEILNNPPPQPPPNLPDPSELIAQLKQLEELLSLSPEKLQKLRQTVEFIEKMSEAEREAMRIRISQVTQMTDELRQEIETLCRLVPGIHKPDVSQFWLAERKVDRDRKRSALADLSAPDQSKLLREWITDFVEKREEVFKEMKEALEAKKAGLGKRSGQPATP
ncbi:hypothetical protein G0Q06_09485 [Puniceicoccales bacterium CK1056]|uniref:Periplasmic heavy metal sensor n=1 Tax=Oceanipulchritudo coccoides TaxID=2706888 RepID=A0A6B2M120_9BACT|nr:hypothetical protein [Oceanipulchritudo coccoides]NDV62681.1 hypothetical protein [Oceanipulchritudo coccoides]